MVGEDYVTKHNIKTKPLKHKVQLVYMDGLSKAIITHATWQTVKIPGTNGIKTFRIKYLVAPIPEGFVLGATWLAYADPDISWRRKALRWREEETVISARRARKRIIQSEVPYNEPPDWVKKKHPKVLDQSSNDTLPPHRPEFDYEVIMKPGFKPRKEPPRSYSAEERRMFRELGDREYKAGRWRLGSGPQAVQMLWAAKAGNDKRPCHDFRPINPWIVDNVFPIPSIKEMMEDIGGSMYFTSLDLPKAYNKIRIKNKESEDLLAFYCGDILYAPRVMQFGSKTAVSHFQKVITTILRDKIGKGVRVYLDNIAIYTKTEKEHDEIVDWVLTQLEKNDFNIQPKKCEWYKDEIQFCGYLIGRQGIRFDPAKIQAITEWLPPKSSDPLKRTKIREFVGFCNYYRDGIKDFSTIAKPLTDLTSKKREFKWTKEHTASWQLLKMAAISAPVRAAYDANVPIEIFSDASNDGTGGVIQHRYPDGTTRPIAFHSSKFKPAERNYDTHDRELLAIVKIFKAFHSWLHGTKEPIKVWCDHRALVHFLTKRNLTARQARWAEILSQYNFKIQYVKGKENVAADALSRMHSTTEPSEAVQLLHEHQFQEMS